MTTVDEKPDSRGSRRWIVPGAIAVILVLVIVFALQNTEDASVDWLFWSATGPLIFVILASALAGFLLGVGVVMLRRRRQHRS